MSLPQHYGSLLDALVGVTWPARRPVEAGMAGTHASRLRGLTAEFTEYRPYRQGDDSRRLDWKLLARTDRAHLRITDERATRTTLVVLDASASMAFPATTLEKWAQACRLAIGLTAVARGEGDPAGMSIVTPQGVTRIPPRARKGVIGDIARAFDGITPSGVVDLRPGLEGVRSRWRVVLLSDFLGGEEAVVSRSRELVIGGAEVYAIHIVAPAELVPGDTLRVATDPEEPDLRRTLHPAAIEEYQAAFVSWRKRLADGFRQSGVEYLEVRSNEDPATVIRQIARGAGQRRNAR
ncbi:MAG TPA: DUF58 domain-containing protein [Gemmatimonadales bacterium]|nr:DUF58 domain-containing protein [Gemmatimonadales bacterium]